MRQPADTIMESIIKLNRMTDYVDDKVAPHYADGTQAHVYDHMRGLLEQAYNCLDIMLIEAKGAERARLFDGDDNSLLPGLLGVPGRFSGIKWRDGR